MATAVVVVLAGCGRAVAPPAGGGGVVTGGDSTGSAVMDPPTSGSMLYTGSEVDVPECPMPPQASVRPVPVDRASISAAHVCTVEEVTRANGDVWRSIRVNTVTGGLSALLDAYAKTEPGPPAAGDAVCPAIGYVQHLVWLTIRGQVFPIAEPFVGECPAPDPAAVAAFEALALVPGREVPVARVSSALAQRSGCDVVVKDVTAVVGHDPAGMTPPPAPRPLVASGAAVRACVYTAGEPSADGTPAMEGTLVAGRDLTAAELASVDAGLAAVTPIGDCDPTTGTRFVVFPEGDWTQVSVDGCAVSQGNDLWRAPASLRAALAAIG